MVVSEINNFNSRKQQRGSSPTCRYTFAECLFLLSSILDTRTLGLISDQRNTRTRTPDQHEDPVVVGLGTTSNTAEYRKGDSAKANTVYFDDSHGTKSFKAGVEGWNPGVAGSHTNTTRMDRQCLSWDAGNPASESLYQQFKKQQNAGMPRCRAPA